MLQTASDPATRALQVSVVPNEPAALGNRLFDVSGLSGTHAGNAHWIEPLATLRAHGRARNISLDTIDVVPAELADVILFLELPSSPSVITNLCRAAQRAKTILMPIETPLGRDYVFNPRNHVLFDAVITYDERLCDGRRYFHCRLPAGQPDVALEDPPFEARKVASVFATKSRWRLRSGVRVASAGWRFSLRDRLSYMFLRGQLLTERTRVVTAFADLAPDSCDVFGAGWHDAAAVREVARSTMFRGPVAENKLKLLSAYRFSICFENCDNDRGYVSEKLFDALFGNT
ncbi:MAG: hypothetical protein ACREXY_25460, partial [Gammaproteobacteria bacterium]